MKTNVQDFVAPIEIRKIAFCNSGIIKNITQNVKKNGDFRAEFPTSVILHIFSLNIHAFFTLNFPNVEISKIQNKIFLCKYFK